MDTEEGRMAMILRNQRRTTAPGGEVGRAGNVIGEGRAGGGNERARRLVIG